MRILLLALTTCLLAPFLAPISGASEILLASSIKRKLQQKISQDLQVLGEMSFKRPADPETLRLLGIDSLSSTLLEEWLQERVKYIVDEKAPSFLKLPFSTSLSIERELVAYPNSGHVPEEESPVNLTSDEAVTVMNNLGAALYLKGKREQRIYRMKIPLGLLKSTTVSIDSPRSGIIQIGEGLFERQFSINNHNPDSIANSIHRLGVFFHEARHSDGNGASLAFVHALCPKGHDLEGLYACDENNNGPYSLSARVVKEMIKDCEGLCTEREKEILKLTVLDSQGRVLEKTAQGGAITSWPEAPETVE